MDGILILFCASGFGILFVLIPRLINSELMKIVNRDVYSYWNITLLVIIHILFAFFVLVYETRKDALGGFFVAYSIFILPIALTFALIKALAFFVRSRKTPLIAWLFVILVPLLIIPNSTVVFAALRFHLGLNNLLELFSPTYILWSFINSLPTMLAGVLFIIWLRSFFGDKTSSNALRDFSHVKLGYFLIVINLIYIFLGIFNPG